MRVIDLVELERQGEITLGRGKVISAKTLAQFPGEYPVYSSSTKGEGVFGRYGQYDFDEELLTWSVDGGGDFFHRKKHCFSITNVAGFLRINAKANIEYRFLYYLLRFKHARANFDWTYKAHPSVLRRVYKDLPIPPLEEQKRIAGILDEADRVRKKTQALIDKYDELAQSLFLDMFGDPVTNPKGWDELPVANFVETIIDYRGKTPPKSPQGIPLLSSANVHKGKIDLSYKQFISQEDFEKWTVRGFTQPKDLLFTTEAPVGEVAVIPDDGNTYQISRRVMAMRFKDSLMNSDFALFVMSSQNWASRLKKLTRGSTVPRVLKPDVLNQLMIAPPLREQLRFAEANQTLLNQQERACTALQVSSTCFDSLLQMAFKGELT